MPCIALSPVRYAPCNGPAAPTVSVGRVYRRLRGDRSRTVRASMRCATKELARRLHDEQLPPEAALLAFKNAIFCFGGVRAFPSLAADHNVDGDDAAVAYAIAFDLFIAAYFGRPAPAP